VTRVLAAGYALSALVTALAWLLTRRRPEHQPIALLLTLGLLSDAARRLLHIFVLVPAHARMDPGPLTGAARAAFHVEQALFLAWPAGLVAAALTIFLRRRPWLVAVAWSLAVAVLALSYPGTRGDVLRRAYLALELATIAVSSGAVIQWGWSRQWPTLAQDILMALIGAEIAVVWGPWRHDLFGGWSASQIMYSVTYFIIAVLQGGMLWKHSRQS
jgi:hypothetical protein